ncbi:MAG: site-specific integrase [Neisseria sp.]|nr:site-specific integrase [Neisseria sp.]
MRTPSGKRIRRSAGTQDIQKAKELRDKLAHEFWQQRYIGIKPKRLWDEAVVQWLHEKADKKSIDTDINRLRQLGKLRGIFLHDLTREVIMGVINELPCKASTKNRYIALVRAILYKARDEWEWIDKAPKLKQLKEPTKRIRWLKADEAQRLVMALPDNFWRQMVIFSLATGLRQSNVFSLKWEQIDLHRKIAWIHSDETKSGRSIGIPLNELAMNVLADRLGVHRVYVFTSNKNQPITSLNRKVWLQALQKAGISDFRWHDLRHTWASWLVQQGVPILALKEMGGWEKLDMVMRYAHLAIDHLAPHATVLDNLNSFGHKMDTLRREGRQ